ncbi:MAG: AAA family ATPase [Candidatus Pacebacteria bacterium]|nr:AAA family ATPase [Candidatus Paceibacterota bacterium]
MHLKSLEISGFKSFAKKAELDFNTKVTAIVGPNGSGKSNVAESFRFVLGEQSIKSMRGKRGEDLIFNGSGDVLRMSKASVKIVFDNSKRFLDIDFDEVSIERTVHRDGNNEYWINGSSVRLKDVSELLSKANIGSTGHHIISQGEADRILSANIKERKSMIEDALGLRVYQYKLAESNKKLEKTEDNIREVGLLRKEIAPHLKFLKKQIEKIEKAEELKRQLEALYGEYLKREYVYLEKEKDALEKEGKDPKEKLERLEKELKDANEKLESSKEKDEKSEELLSLEKEIQMVRGEKDSLTRELGRVEGEIQSQKRLIQRQEEQFSSNQPIPFDEVKNLSLQVEKDLDSISIEEDFSVVRGVLLKVRESIKTFISRYQNTESDLLKEARSDVNKLEGEKGDIEKQIEEVDIKSNSINSKYEKIQKEIEAEKDSERSAETAVFRIRAERNEVQSILNDIKNREIIYLKDKNNFDEELKEGMVLIGSKITSFKIFQIEGEESREKQESRRKELEKMKIRLEDMGGSSDDVVKEYKEVAEREEFLIKELEDLEKTSSSLKDLIVDLRNQLDTEFKDGIRKINTEFQNFFSLMFGGGNASLSVVEAQKRKKSDLDIFSEEEIEEEVEEGIDISVSLPRKKVKGLMMLSGGERALTSIALLFAMSQVKPPPFIILDETDAALDEANSKKYGDMIENLSKHSQLILITHNRETMSRAGVLYGVTMGTGGVSKLLSVAFDEAVVVAK